MEILLTHPDNQLLHHIFLDTQNILKEFGLIIAPDKIQKIIIWDTFLIIIQYPLKRYKDGLNKGQKWCGPNRSKIY